MTNEAETPPTFDTRLGGIEGFLSNFNISRRAFLGSSAAALTSVIRPSIAAESNPNLDLSIVIRDRQVNFVLTKSDEKLSVEQCVGVAQGPVILSFLLNHFGSSARASLYYASADRKMLRLDSVSFGALRNCRLDFYFQRVRGFWRIWLESAFLRPEVEESIGLGAGHFEDPTTWPHFEDFYLADDLQTERPPLSLKISPQRVRYFLDGAFGRNAVVSPTQPARISFHRNAVWRLKAERGSYFSCLQGAAKTDEVRLGWVDTDRSPVSVVRRAISELSTTEDDASVPVAPGKVATTHDHDSHDDLACETDSSLNSPTITPYPLWEDLRLVQDLVEQPEGFARAGDDHQCDDSNTSENRERTGKNSFAVIGLSYEDSLTNPIVVRGDPCSVRIQTESATFAAEANESVHPSHSRSVVVLSARMRLSVNDSSGVRLNSLPPMAGYVWQVHSKQEAMRLGASIRLPEGEFKANTHLGCFQIHRLDPVALRPDTPPEEPRLEIRALRSKLVQLSMPCALISTDHKVGGASFSHLTFNRAVFELMIGDAPSTTALFESYVRLDHEALNQAPALRLVLDQAALKVARDRDLLSLVYRFKDLAFELLGPDDPTPRLRPYHSGRADAVEPLNLRALEFSSALKAGITHDGEVESHFVRPVLEERGGRTEAASSLDQRATLVVDFGVMHTAEKTYLTPEILQASLCDNDDSSPAKLLKSELARDTFNTNDKTLIIHQLPDSTLDGSQLHAYLLQIEVARENRSPAYQLLRDAFRESQLKKSSRVSREVPLNEAVEKLSWKSEFLYGATAEYARKSGFYHIPDAELDAFVENFFSKSTESGFDDLVTETRHSGRTRIAFRIDEADYGDMSRAGVLDYTLSGLTDWRRFDLSVIRRAEKLFEPGENGRLPPKWARSEIIDETQKLLHQGFVKDPGQSAGRWMARVATLAETVPSDLQTSIELPARLVLSPAQDATIAAPEEIQPIVARSLFDGDKPRIRERLVKLEVIDTERSPHDSIERTDLWVAETELEASLPAIRAVASPDFRPETFLRVVNDLASNEPPLGGVQIPGSSPPPYGPIAPWTLGTFDTNGGPADSLPVLEEKNSFWKSFFSRPRHKAELFRQPLDAGDRHQVVGLSSVYGLRTRGRRAPGGQLLGVESNSRTASQFEPPFGFHLHDLQDDEAIYRPEPLQVKELTLSALGGSIDMDTAFVPPASARHINNRPLFNAFSIERYRHRIVLGRDISAEVVYKGFLFPYGFRAAYVKVTERRFEVRRLGEVPRCYLVQRLFLRCTRPVIAYPGVAQPNAGRQWPCRQMQLLTTESPDLIDPATEFIAPSSHHGDFPATELPVVVNDRGRIFTNSSSQGLVFWPQTKRYCSTSDTGGRVRFSLQFDGKGTAGPCPMIFVDNTAANERATLEKLAEFWDRDWLREGEDTYGFAMDPWFNQACSLRHHGLPQRYAPESTAGDTSHETDQWTVGVQGAQSQAATTIPREGTDKKLIYEGVDSYAGNSVLEGLEIPPFYPVMREARIRIRRLERLQGRAINFTRVRFDGEFVREGLPAQASERSDTATLYNPARIYLNLLDKTTIEMGAQGDRAGCIGRPEGTVVALSQSTGIINGVFDTVNDALSSSAAKREYTNLPLRSLDYATHAIQPARQPVKRNSDTTSTSKLKEDKLEKLRELGRSDLLDAQEELDSLTDKIFGDKKLLGIVKYSEICQVALDLAVDSSPARRAAASIEEYTDSVSEDLSYGASLLGEDILDSVKAKVIVPLIEGIGGFRRKLDSVNIRFPANDGANATQLQLRELYPDVFVTMERFEQSLSSAQAENDPISFGLKIGGCYEDGNGFVRSVENVARDPLGPAESVLYGKLQSRLNTVLSDIDVYKDQIQTLLTGSKDEFLNLQNGLISVLRDQLIAAPRTIANVYWPVFEQQLGIQADSALSAAWSKCVEKEVTVGNAIELLNEPHLVIRNIVICFTKEASTSLGRLIRARAVTSEEVLYLRQAIDQYKQLESDINAGNFNAFLSPKMQAASNSLQSIVTTVNSFDNNPVRSVTSLVSDVQSLATATGLSSELLDGSEIDLISTDACRTFLQTLRDLSQALEFPTLSQKPGIAALVEHLKRPTFDQICKDLPAFDAQEDHVQALIAPVNALCSVKERVKSAYNSLPESVRKSHANELEKSAGALVENVDAIGTELATAAHSALSALMAFDNTRAVLRSTLGDSSTVNQLIADLRSPVKLVATADKLIKESSAYLTQLQSALAQLLSALGQISTLLARLSKSIDSAHLENGRSALDNTNKELLKRAFDEANTFLAGDIAPQLENLLVFTRRYTVLGIRNANGALNDRLSTLASLLENSDFAPFKELAKPLRSFTKDDPLFDGLVEPLNVAIGALSNAKNLEQINKVLQNLHSGLKSSISDFGEADTEALEATLSNLSDAIIERIQSRLNNSVDQLLSNATTLAIDVLKPVERALGSIVKALLPPVIELYAKTLQYRNELHQTITGSTGVLRYLNADQLILEPITNKQTPLQTDVLAREATNLEQLGDIKEPETIVSVLIRGRGSLKDIIDSEMLVQLMRGDREPAPLMLIKRLKDRILDALRGNFAGLIDMQQIRLEIEQYLSQLIPTKATTRFSHHLRLGNFPPNDPILITNRSGGQGSMRLSAKTEIDLAGIVTGETIKPTFEASAELSAFSVILIGQKFHGITFHFSKAKFSASSDRAAEMDVILDSFELGPLLSFVDQLSSFFPNGGNGFYVEPTFSPLGIRAGYGLNIGMISLGNCSFTNVSINAEARLPFDGGEAMFIASLATRKDPCILSWAPFGGTMYFGLLASAKGLVGLEAGFEGGAVAAFGIGPLHGIGRITFGVYVGSVEGRTTIGAVFYVGGSARLWIFGIAASLFLSAGQDSNGAMSGEAVFTYSFSIGFADFEFEVVFWKQENKNFGGNGDEQRASEAPATPADSVDSSPSQSSGIVSPGGVPDATHGVLGVYGATGMEGTSEESSASHINHILESTAVCQGVDWRRYKRYFADNARTQAVDPGGRL